MVAGGVARVFLEVVHSPVGKRLRVNVLMLVRRWAALARLSCGVCVWGGGRRVREGGDEVEMVTWKKKKKKKKKKQKKKKKRKKKKVVTEG